MGSFHWEDLFRLELTGSHRTTIEVARTVMGCNFFGPEDAQHCFGIELAPEVVDYFTQVPFSEGMLLSSRTTHVLVAMIRLSIRQLQEMARVGQLKFVPTLTSTHGETIGDLPIFCDQNLDDRQLLADVSGPYRWRLIAKSPVPGSLNKPWDDQLRLFEGNGRAPHSESDQHGVASDEVPVVHEVVYTAIAHFLATGEWLYENAFLRCANPITRNSHVTVGYFGPEGLAISQATRTQTVPSLGLASARVASRL